MSPETDALEDYLNSGESVITEVAATCSENQFREPVTVGLTDRRLLWLAHDGEVVTVGYDSVCTIRNRPWSTRAFRGNDYRVLLGGGVLLGTLGLSLVVSFAASALSVSLSLLTVAGLASTEWLRRRSDALENASPASLGDGDRRVIDWTPLRRIDAPSPDSGWVAPLATGLVAVGGFAGLTLLAPGFPVFGALVLLVGGLGVVDYAYRHRTELDGFEVVREQTQEVTLRTLDGRSIRLRSDPSEQLYRELSSAVFVGDVDRPRPRSRRRDAPRPGADTVPENVGAAP